jgi:two-component system response regulator
VEDNPDDAALSIRALKKNRVVDDIALVCDGVQALDYLFCEGSFSAREHEDLPQVVLLDLKLPKLDGLGVLQRLRADKRTKLLPVVILTSSNEESDRVQAYGSGANSYVRKPVDFDAFVAAAAQLGLYWLVLNESPPPIGA